MPVVLCLSIKSANAQTWSALGPGLDYEVNTFAVYNGDLYAGSDGIYKWTDTNWTSFNTGTNTLGGGIIYSLCVSNGNNFYAGGAGFFVLTPDGNWYNYIGRWDGNKWTTVGSGLGNDGWGMGSDVFALASYNGELYAGGNFGTAGGDPINQQEVYYIANFAGTVCCWNPVGSGMDDKVNVLTTDTVNNFLYAGGYFITAGGITVNYIAKWDGTNWSALGTGTDGKVTALCIHNGELYAGGAFTIAGGVSAKNIAKWNGSSWQALGNGVDGQVYCLSSYKGNLYAGGYNLFLSEDYKYIAKWDGTTWSALGSGVNDYVNSFIIFDDDLYVGGAFTNAGGIPVNHIAKWTPANVIEENSINNTVNIYPNPGNGKLSVISKNTSVMYEVEIYNILGKKIYNTQFSGKTEIDLSKEAKGVYFYTLRSRKEILATGKLIVE